MDDMARKIRELRKKLGLNQTEFAARLGLDDQSTVSKWERGKQRPSSERNAKLAAMAGQDIGEWLGIEPMRHHEMKTTGVMVIGAVQAGAWKEAIEWPFDDQYEVPVPRDPSRPIVPLQGFVVRGTSMDRLYPAGSLVFVASTIQNGIKPRNGDIVLVSRRNADGLHEATLKEYVVNDDGSRWLWPRSYDPEHQAPIAYRDSQTEEVTVTGVVETSVLFRNPR